MQTVKEKNSVATIRELAKDRLEQALHETGKADAPAVAISVQHELASNPEFLARFWNDGAGRTLCYDIVLDVLRRMRHDVQINSLFNATLEHDGSENKSIFEGWTIHSGVHFSILRMGRVELFAAVEERRETNIDTVTTERLMLQLASVINEDEVVGDRFTVEQIIDLKAKIQEETRKDLSKWKPKFFQVKP